MLVSGSGSRVGSGCPGDDCRNSLHRYVSRLGRLKELHQKVCLGMRHLYSAIAHRLSTSRFADAPISPKLNSRRLPGYWTDPAAKLPRRKRSRTPVPGHTQGSCGRVHAGRGAAGSTGSTVESRCAIGEFRNGPLSGEVPVSGAGRFPSLRSRSVTRPHCGDPQRNIPP